MLLTTLPVDGDLPIQTLAPWDEPGLPPPAKNWATRAELLWDDGKDLPGSRLLVPWHPGGRLWFPRRDALWTFDGVAWVFWTLSDGTWRRQEAANGVLCAHPSGAMGRIALDKTERPMRYLSPVDKVDWREVPDAAESWPDYDAAWLWRSDEEALTAWDQRWGKPKEPLPKERQREALLKSFRSDWITASRLRASVRGWLPEGPEVAMRESVSVAWVWVGDRILLVRLQSWERSRELKGLLRAP
jgi:hypothetical protein